ncbi:hypothetical protein ACI3LY_004132 [Candidozyma auris]|nr:hypothetical_protein [[Candida] auris]PIS55867.1 hypothetical protein CJI97_001104 [[Candida] auris]PIS56953.1 hypothetical protein B9J08_001500 [[Candida] auris]PSK77222.1 hypothetical protein CJJ07_002936 [[Candida] auris]QEO22787.1 hypothetical_protein [[Candida] auris]
MSNVKSGRKVWDSYYHFFPFYMLTGKESVMLHLFIISFISFICWGIYSCLPGYVPFVISRGKYYLTGSHEALGNFVLKMK